jgi:hypothetical protein
MTKKSTTKKAEPRQPDPETLHTTDPQEHMKGPVSSFMQKVKEEAEDNDKQSKEDVEEERRRNKDPFKPIPKQG